MWTTPGTVTPVNRSDNGNSLLIRMMAVALFGMALFIGLFIPLLGVDSVFPVLLIVMVVLAMTGFVVVGFAALRGKSWALIGYIALTISLIDSVFRNREIAAQSIDLQTFVKLCIWCGGAFISVWTVRNAIQRSFKGDIKWLMLFSLFALASTAYSLSPAYTFGAGLAAVCYCLLAVGVVERLSQKQILLGLLLGLCLLLGASLLLYFGTGFGMANLEGGNVQRLAGLAGSPNALGRAASLAILVVVVLVTTHKTSIFKWYCLLAVAMAVLCLVLADSRTSLVATFLGFTMYYFRRHLVLAVIVSVAVFLTLMLILNVNIPWADIAASFSRTGRVSEITTLTGRTDIWSAAWKAFLDKPLFGHGFGATKILIPQIFQTYWGFTTTQAHNFYLQTLVTTGVVGMSFVAMALFRQAVGFVRKPQMFSAVVFIYILVYGLAEAGPIGPAPNILTFFWALSICWDRARADVGGDNKAGNQA